MTGIGLKEVSALGMARGGTNVDVCECLTWRRDIDMYPHLKRKGIPSFVCTDHNPRCEHYNDSLIDVWKVSYEGQSYYTDKPPSPEDTENGETVTQERMHREVFEQLDEFEGF